MDMKKMMKQAQKMQRDAAAAQQEIAAMTFEASAGGGMVKATATFTPSIILFSMMGSLSFAVRLMPRWFTISS